MQKKTILILVAICSISLVQSCSFEEIKQSISSSAENNLSVSSDLSDSIYSSSSSAFSSHTESHDELKTYKSRCNEAYLEWDAIDSASGYKVYAKDSESDSYLSVDSELIDGTKAYVKGLAKGKAFFKIVPVIDNIEDISKQIIANREVIDTDRDGYAGFDYSSFGTGAYKSDGHLKDDALVIYVDDTNKNTVSYSSYIGLVRILQNQYRINRPLDIRIKGRIASNIFKYKRFNPSVSGDNPSIRDSSDYENTFETSYTNLNNLRFKFFGSDSSDLKAFYSGLNTGFAFDYSAKTSYKDTDSYFSMCDVSGCSDITLEGIGGDAEIFQWGLTFSKCSNIEVKNLTFTDYQEDACSFQGESNSNINNYRNFFVHNCVFNKGKNNFDLSQEQDKGDGDGSTDIKYLRGVTLSYNTYNLTHKTGLIGGDKSQLTMDVSFHHNFYNQDKARLPLGRQVNLHSYNNYFYKCSTCYQMRSNSYTLSESNCFDCCAKTAEVKAEGAYAAGVIKSYLNKFIGCSEDAMTAVDSRDAEVTNSCRPDGSTDYSSFDTDPDLFYYDSVNNVTDAEDIIDADLVKEYVTSNAGMLY